MAKYIINGGKKLSGSIKPKGNKNEALPAIAAAALGTGVVTLFNVPRIADIDVMVEIFNSIGGIATFVDHSTLKLDPRPINKSEIPEELARKIRTSFLYAAPLLGRLKKAVIPPPGGDVIGRRGLHCHFQGLAGLGTEIKLTDKYEMSTPHGFSANTIFLDEPSVTGTEQTLCAAVTAKGITKIQNAAMEPHIVGLCHMLNAMGADIRNVGGSTLSVHGVKELKGCEHTIGTDYIEVGSFITMALVTGSEILILDHSLKEMPMITRTFERFGAKLIFNESGILIPKDQKLSHEHDISGAVPIITDGPWPQFPTDLMSNIIVLATKTGGGMCMIHEKMFDKRMYFVDLLMATGANIIVCDPHRIVVSGPCTYRPGRFESPDIRAGISLLIAALSADGESSISNIRQIDRGYENIHERLTALGADIKRVE